MPIYEFKCNRCEKIFEQLIFSSDEEAKLACPLCGERDTCKLMSSFSSGSSSICPTSSGGFSWAAWPPQSWAVTSVSIIQIWWIIYGSKKGEEKEANEWMVVYFDYWNLGFSSGVSLA